MIITSVTVAQSFTPPSYADIDVNYRNYVNQVFGALETNRVPTGLLLDYAFDFSDPKIYNGTLLEDSTLMEPALYSDLYKTIYTSRVNTTVSGMRHPNLQDSLCYIARQKEVITISGLLFKYNAIDPNAQSNGKMQTVNGQLKDVYTGGVWQNPYQEFKTIAFTPSINSYNLTYCNVVFPAGLFTSNMTGDIASLKFDAGDGQGYRNISYDVPVALNYPDTGFRHWVFQVTLNSGEQLYSHAKIHFSNVSNAMGSQGVGARSTVDRNRSIVATESYNGIFGSAYLAISYHDQNDKVLRRPLIVAEGFDPGFITKPEEPEGVNTFNGFINSVLRSGSNDLRNLICDNPSQYDIIYVNWNKGTDYLQVNELVLEEVIRWVNANKQPLNGVMQPNVVLGSSMGGVIARMALGRMDRNGGYASHQTSLYVSLDAPHQGANVPLGFQAADRHATRMYISTGPLVAGLAEVVSFILNRASPLQTLLLIDQPAAKQLLMQRMNINYGIDNTVYQQFMQELRTQWAYPVNIRNVAISDGSECGIDQEFAGGSTLLYHYRSTKTKILGDLISMVVGSAFVARTTLPFGAPLTVPGSNRFQLTLDIKALANGGGNQVYYGNISYTKKVLWLVNVTTTIANKLYTAPTGLLPLDTYPGGFYEVSIENQPGTTSQDWMFTYDNTFVIQRRFAFIHTTSALDIGGGNTALSNTEYLARYIGSAPPASPFNTPFQNFTTAFNNPPLVITRRRPDFSIIYQITSTGDQPHEGLFIRSANWLANEINNTPVTTNCSYLCSGNTNVINGAASICGSAQTYTLNGVPSNAIVTWSVTPAGIVNINPTGPSTNQTTTLTPIGSGAITLKVDLVSECGINSYTKTIVVGLPDWSKLSIVSQGPTVCPNVPVGFGARYDGNCTNFLAMGITNVLWSVSPSPTQIVYNAGTSGCGEANNSGVTIKFPGQSTSYYVNVRVSATNVCGTSFQSDAYLVQVKSTSMCGGGGPQFVVSPNPSSGNVTVASAASASAATSESTALKSTGSPGENKIYEIKVTDVQGAIKKSYKHPLGTTSVNLDLSSLKNGTYFIQTYNNSIWESHQFIMLK